MIADDQPDVLEALRLLLKGEGFEIESAASPMGILAALETRDFDVVLMDLNYTRDTTSGQEGLDTLMRIQAIDGNVPVVVMTAWGSVELAVEAMRRGAQSGFYPEAVGQCPTDDQRADAGVVDKRTAPMAEAGGAESAAADRGAADAERGIGGYATGSATGFRGVGPSDANVLITGEPGTGKEVVARTLHTVSLRHSRPMVTVNAGGLAEGIFESELFGHVKGAFTDAKMDRVGRFELADGGTLFLDEIANVPMNLQAKLLRVLEIGEMERVGSSKTRRVDARVISATNAVLTEEVAAGRFRQDLLFRLNTIEIHLPPLRERRDDIPVLAAHFLGVHARRYRKNLQGFDAAARDASFAGESVAGKRREELNHVIERAVLMAQDTQVRQADLALRSGAQGALRLEDMSLEEVEAFLVQKSSGSIQREDVSHAASALGLSRSALYRRLQRYVL